MSDRVGDTQGTNHLSSEACGPAPAPMVGVTMLPSSSGRFEYCPEASTGLCKASPLSAKQKQTNKTKKMKNPQIGSCEGTCQYAQEIIISLLGRE